MTDAPYQLDPFTVVTNVQFGSGVWMFLACNGGNPSLPGVEFDFIDVGGGTPGFLLPQAFHDGPGGIFTQVLGPPNFSLNVTQAMITKKTFMNAGHSILGQIAWWVNGFEAGGTGMLFGLSTMPNQFKVRVTDPATAGGAVGLTFKGAVKPGVLTPNGTILQSSIGVPNGQTVLIDQVAGTCTIL